MIEKLNHLVKLDNIDVYRIHHWLNGSAIGWLIKGKLVDMGF